MVHSMMWAASQGQVLAGESGSGDIGSLGLLLYLSGFVFYGLMYLRYRNVDKRHMHARETEATIDNLQATDELKGKRTRLRNKRMDGANERHIEGAQLSGIGQLLGGVSQRTGALQKVFTSFR